MSSDGDTAVVANDRPTREDVLADLGLAAMVAGLTNNLEAIADELFGILEACLGASDRLNMLDRSDMSAGVQRLLHTIMIDGDQRPPSRSVHARLNKFYGLKPDESFVVDSDEDQVNVKVDSID